MDVSKVTRVDVVDHRVGQEPFRADFFGVTPELVLQDDGRTLKVFIRDHPTATDPDVRQDIVRRMTVEMEAVRAAHRSVVRRPLTE